MLNSDAANYVRKWLKGQTLTALDLNLLLHDAGVSCYAPAQLLEELYRNGEVELVGTNPGLRPQKVYRVASQWV